MYATIDDFLLDWKAESKATLRVLKALTDRSLSQKVSPEGRSLGYLAWHIALAIGEMGGRAGLAIDAPAEESAEPAAAAEIVSAYRKAARSLDVQVRERWTDAMLADELEMYGAKWKRTTVLASLVRHQIHHRGQLTVLMRQAGLTVPGVYGPAREEWAKMGMDPQR